MKTLQLLLRTGFCPTVDELQAASRFAPKDAIDRIVARAASRIDASIEPPDWVGEPLPAPGALKDADEALRRAARRELVKRHLDLQSWWLQEMLTTPQPLTERMTLFWHGHFTSGVQRVRAPQLLYRQNLLLRSHALGNYRDLLHGIARDPAMLIYLDNQQNRKGAPNENFARELLELFTLGEGHYSEQDVAAAAKAFTGWKALPPEGRFVALPRQHDDSEKLFLGQRGNFDGDAVIDIILRQPRAAEFIVARLWREFVSTTPDERAVRQLAASFARDWEIAPLMRDLLHEPQFERDANAGTLVKSPVEFVVGTARALQLDLQPWMAARACADMGQALFNPPNVKGWPQGTDWITSQWLLARRQFVLALSGNAALPGATGEAPAMKLRKLATRAMQREDSGIVRQFGATAERLPPGDLAARLLVLPPVMAPADSAKPSDRLETLLLDPVYQLK